MVPPNEMTMQKKLHRIGHGIHPSIQVMVNFPSNNETGRMLVLDTEHWMLDVVINGTWASPTLELLATHVQPIRHAH